MAHKCCLDQICFFDLRPLQNSDTTNLRVGCQDSLLSNGQFQFTPVAASKCVGQNQHCLSTFPNTVQNVAGH